MACLEIAGAMRICPTTALEIMLHIAPLYLQVKQIVALSAYRLGLLNKASSVPNSSQNRGQIIRNVNGTQSP